MAVRWAGANARAEARFLEFSFLKALENSVGDSKENISPNEKKDPSDLCSFSIKFIFHFELK